MQLKFRHASSPANKWRGVLLPLTIIALLFLLIHHARRKSGKANNASSPRIRTQTASLSTTTSKQEQLPIYELPKSSFSTEPAHLTPIDPSLLIPKGSHPIDIAHRNGFLHTGHSVYIMDAAGKILFLQRSSDVVTCPGTWSILGEHANIGEDARQTVVRGIEEELGFAALGYDESPDFPGAWSADFHPNNNFKKESLHVTIQNVTQFPLYYIRHYGPRNENRIDRQLAYLWLVQFPKKHEEIAWVLDDEVADHKWISLDDVGAWLSNDAIDDKKLDTASSTAEGGSVKDDGPDEGDFCHWTIRSLYEVGLMSML